MTTRPCVLCRQPARLGRACDACRERVRTAPRRPRQQARRRRPPPRPADAVDVARFREALARSGDPVELVAKRLGWEPSRLERKLRQAWVGPHVAMLLCRALHVAPVEVGL